MPKNEKETQSIALRILKEQLEEGRKVTDITEETDFRESAIHLRIYKELEGAIDLHIHPIPDGYPRLLDDVEVAAQAKAVKMRAISIKCMVSATPDRAYIAQRAVGGGIDVYGIICLNVYLGGFNVEAVRMALRMGAKGVWMPSQWTAHEVQYYRKSMDLMGGETIGVDYEEGGLCIFSDNGGILPEVTEILQMVADHDIMLSTGHLSLKEAHALLDEANRVGVKKKLVHTVNYHVMGYPLEELLKMVEKGAFLEFAFTSLPYPIWGPADPNLRISLDDVCRYIRKVGPKHCVLTTDSGQTTSPTPIECMRLWIELLKIKGFEKKDIDLMIKKNPAILLGLE